jgi:serine/threonine protein kinase
MITDFGLSKDNIVGDQVNSFSGTYEYFAPEILKL